jgi:hypothetical protein
MPPDVSIKHSLFFRDRFLCLYIPSAGKIRVFGLAAIQMLDVHFLPADGRTLILSRHTELNTDQKLLVSQFNLPSQAPPTHDGRPPTRRRTIAKM